MKLYSTRQSIIIVRKQTRKQKNKLTGCRYNELSEVKSRLRMKHDVYLRVFRNVTDV